MPGALFRPVSLGSGAFTGGPVSVTVPDEQTDRGRVKSLCYHFGFESLAEFMVDEQVKEVREIIFKLLMLKKDGYPGSRLADLILGVPNGLVGVVLEHALFEGEVRRTRYKHKPSDFEYRLTIEKWVELEATK